MSAQTPRGRKYLRDYVELRQPHILGPHRNGEYILRNLERKQKMQLSEHPVKPYTNI